MIDRKIVAIVAGCIFLIPQEVRDAVVAQSSEMREFWWYFNDTLSLNVCQLKPKCFSCDLVGISL